MSDEPTLGGLTLRDWKNAQESWEERSREQAARIEELEEESIRWMALTHDVEAQNIHLREERDRLRGLLKVAKCPNYACDGNGYPVQVGEDDWEQEQCQWCFERNLELNFDESKSAMSDEPTIVERLRNSNSADRMGDRDVVPASTALAAAARIEELEQDLQQARAKLHKANKDVLTLILEETNTTVEEADARGGTPFDMLRRMIDERNTLRKERDRLRMSLIDLEERGCIRQESPGDFFCIRKGLALLCSCCTAHRALNPDESEADVREGEGHSES